MPQKRVHVVTTVNAKNVSKEGDKYIIRNVCAAVDDIVMNGVLYPAKELAKAARSLEGKPAPGGHPKNAAGQYISALNGEALLNSYAGAICWNARHDGGRTMADVHVNGAQAAANADGKKVVEWCEAAVNGLDPAPIHVSTGLIANMLDESGESGGQKYTRIATDMAYDHLALLPDGRGAGTPEQGVGMFNDGTETLQEIEVVRLKTEPEDRRGAGFGAWIKRLLGNSDISFDQITSGLYPLLQRDCWLREVFDRYAIWCDGEGRLWKQDYSVSSDGSVAFSGSAVEVIRKVEYETVTNQQKDADSMKPQIVAALNAAGIKTDGLDDAQLLTAYNALVAKPVEEKLAAANTKVATFEQNALAAEKLEVNAIAKELAANGGSLTEADLAMLPLARLKELKTNAVAAVVLPGAGGAAKPGDEFKGYSLNAHIEEKK